ncbi:restriction endonuclease subunit S [Helicobacter pylori]|uniref:restriction endonuclease subunit S n=1 Tax=Helicobacter pylori TaxID=210 RepID=UPI003BAC5AB6
MRLGDIANYLTSNLSAEQITQQGKIKVYDVNNFIGYTNTTFISDKPYISIVKDGSVGRVRILPPKTNILSTMGALIANHKTTTEFLFYLLSNFDFKNFTSGSIIPHIYFKDYKEKTIFLPPLNEQIAIANILSDVDRYLCALDALILKKEGVKKALSFELLSQRKRLKGFNQAWQRVRLGDIILSLKTGLNPRKFFKLNTPNANNYYITVRELEEYTIKFTHQTDRIDDNALSLCLKRSNLEKDDVLFSGTGTIGKVSIIKENPNNWAIKEGIYSIKPNKKIVFPRFLMFCFENLNIQNDIKSKSSEGIVKSISMNDLQQITIPLPPLNEQIAIANILSGLDNEIASLKNKKRQFENIKKALNHDLMSAKIRVLKK